jgi:hypothetical protein
MEISAMKKLLICLLLFTALPVSAQEETLLKGKVESSGFGGPVVKFAEIENELSVLVGGRGGWIINHTFVIGGGGYGLVTENIERGRTIAGNPILLTMGYGGLELEYIHNSNKLIHWSVLTLIGAGGVDEREKNDGYSDRVEGDAFFIFEPAVNLELNVATFFRLGVSGNYRFIAGADFRGIQNGDLAGPAGALTLKFGKF